MYTQLGVITKGTVIEVRFNYNAVCLLSKEMLNKK